MARKTQYLLAALLVLSTAVAAGEVQTFPAKDVELARFQTFKMLPTRVLTGAGVLENDPDVSPMINAALRRELTRKGLTEVSDGADLEVSAGALVVSIPQVEMIIYNLANDATWGTSPLATIGRYNKEGTLIVNLIDAKEKKSVWLGLAKRALPKESHNDRAIDKAARALFNKYPNVVR